MSATLALGLALLLPGVGAVVIGLLHHFPNIREAMSLLTASLLFITVLYLLNAHLNADPQQLQLAELLPGLPVVLVTEPIGLVFAALSSFLWVVISAYSIGYMRGMQERRQTRFYIFFALAMAGVMGVAFAGNLLTLFLFYEMLSLSTYPLVVHRETEEARRGGRIYLGILLGTSIFFFLPAMVWTWWLAGGLAFTPGGILTGKIEGTAAAVLFGLYLFGVGKAALIPVHRWLPAAMVAPTPVSAFLHAVAVVKAGVFTVLKIGVYIFGVGFLSQTSASEWMMWIAAFSMVMASVIALRKDELKARLAYSTVAQLAYVTLGVSLASPMGALGGALQIVSHAMGKITLFMCAGAIEVAGGKKYVSGLRGLGRKMPYTFTAFLLGSLCIIGLPLTGGVWSKYYLMKGGADAGEPILLAFWILSSLLSIAYLMPVVVRGFFLPSPAENEPQQSLEPETSKAVPETIREAPLWCVIPACLTGILSVVLYFLIPSITGFVAPVLEGGVPQ